MWNVNESYRRNIFHTFMFVIKNQSDIFKMQMINQYGVWGKDCEAII